MPVRIHPHVRLAIALVFALASALYSLIWISNARAQRMAPVVLGIEYELDVAARSLRVTWIQEGGPAEAAGLHVGDLVIAVNRRPVDAYHPVRDALRGRAPGETVELLINRNGQTVQENVSLVLARRPPPPLIERAITDLLGTYPLLFLVVGLAVLFQRLGDPHAWRLALLFAGNIASAPIETAVLPPTEAWFASAYVIVFRSLSSAFFYAFFALFPAPSRIHERCPWLVKLGFTTGAALACMFAVRAISSGRPPLAHEATSWSDTATRVFVAVYGGAFLTLGLASLLWNAVASRDNETRRKSRVIVWGTLAAVPAVVLTVLGIVPGQPIYYLFPFWIWAPAVLLLLLMPVSFAYAVVKHRVLEIPVLLRRSARYVLVLRGFTALIVAVAAAVTIVFGSWLARSYALKPDVAIPVGAGLGVSVAWIGTASRRRVTRRIDRAFFRDAYDARQILEELATSSRLATDRAELAALLEGHIVRALHPSFVLVYLVDGSGALRCMQGQAPSGLECLPSDHPWLQSVAAAGGPVVLNPDCLVPMFGRAGPTGLLVVGPRLSEESYSGEDLRLLGNVAAQAGVTAESIALGERIAERLEAERRAQREIEIAREVQVQLLPQRRPELRTLKYAGECVQARVVGGDYFDFLDLGPGRLGFVLADISGKGIAAALLMANLQANLRGHYAMAAEDPVRLIESVNRLFYESTTANRFATLFFGRYDDESRRLDYVNCGHNPPLIVRAGGQIETLPPTAMALGFVDTLRSEMATVQFAPGDALVAYTDGIVEALSDDGEEFGDDRLASTVLAHRDQPAEALLQSILSAVQRFSGNEQDDDLTLVVARGVRP